MIVKNNLPSILPPNITNWCILEKKWSSNRVAKAIFVNGPRASIVTLPKWNQFKKLILIMKNFKLTLELILN